MKKNIVFGSSGLVGSAFYDLLKKKKNFVFYSRNDQRFKKFNLNSDIKKFPFRDINCCFFFSSPRILKKNFINNNFRFELDWLKKIILNIKIKKIIYISSSSVYLKKNHIIGSAKLKCEKFILKKKKLFSNYQIWRPFNLIGDKFVDSEHFHNRLFKDMFLKKKKFSVYSGNLNDKRGYSEVKHFVKILYQHSLKKSSFIKDYGNKNLVTISQILNLFNGYYFKINKKMYRSVFKSNKANINRVKIIKNSVFYKKKSLIILKKFLTKSLNEKNLQHL